MAVVKQQDLRELIVKGIEQARQSSGGVLVSRSMRIPSVDPLSFFACGKQDRFFWMDPEGTSALAGSGVAHRLEAGGEDRFKSIEKQRTEMLENSIIDADRSDPFTGPLFFGGFSFDPLKTKTKLWNGFPDAELVLPSFMLTCTGDETWLTVNVVVDPNDDAKQKARHILIEKDRILTDSKLFPGDLPAKDFEVQEVLPQRFKDSVRDAARSVRDGVMDKVVLSRELRLTSEEPFHPVQVLQSLRENQPNSYLFAIERGEACFIGASPECLVKREENRLFSACMAGTIARGETVEQDDKLGEELLNDPKNLEEHKLVVKMIRSAMKEACHHVEMPRQPILYKVKNVQHLYTPVVGMATDHSDILTVVEQLHPTPALGGFPQQKALEQIREIEPHNRGWYGAPVGWVDYKGDGEFAVAIRSGLLKGKKAVLYAGMGIVGASEPESEYRETQMKFRPMLSALGGIGE